MIFAIQNKGKAEYSLLEKSGSELSKLLTLNSLAAKNGGVF